MFLHWVWPWVWHIAHTTCKYRPTAFTKVSKKIVKIPEECIVLPPLDTGTVTCANLLPLLLTVHVHVLYMRMYTVSQYQVGKPLHWSVCICSSKDYHGISLHMYMCFPCTFVIDAFQSINQIQ